MGGGERGDRKSQYQYVIGQISAVADVMSYDSAASSYHG